MKKPLCKNCPAVRKNNTTIYCVCDKKLKAEYNDERALKRMNDRCPLQWTDKQNSTENK